MISLTDQLRQAILPGKIRSVQLGLIWTTVLAETKEGLRCGLSASLKNPDLELNREPAVRHAGSLHQCSSTELAALIDSPSLTEASIGMAATQALLPEISMPENEIHAKEVILRFGTGKNVVVVGHFPFIEQLKPVLKNLWVLELNPIGEDYPAGAAPDLIPQADLVAITGTTLMNHTIDGLLALCPAHARVMLLGPSTPLSPVLFDLGIDILSGTLVVDPTPVLPVIAQGGSLQQLRQTGSLRFVTIDKETYHAK